MIMMMMMIMKNDNNDDNDNDNNDDNDNDDNDRISSFLNLIINSAFKFHFLRVFNSNGINKLFQYHTLVLLPLNIFDIE